RDTHELRDCKSAIVGMSIDTSADSGAAESQFMQILGVGADVVCSLPNRQPVSGKFLPEPNWHSVLHVRSARLHYFPELLALLFKARGDRIEYGIELLQFDERCQTHRRWEDVVRRLSIVDVIVWMNPLVLAKLAAKNLLRTVGDDFVRVHVKADTGSCLKDIHDELAIPFAVDDLLCRSNDGVRNFRVD